MVEKESPFLFEFDNFAITRKHMIYQKMILYVENKIKEDLFKQNM